MQEFYPDSETDSSSQADMFFSEPVTTPIEIRDASPSTPPVFEKQPRAATQHGQVAASRLIWLMSMLILLLALKYFVPKISEAYVYGVTRGKLRAEYEVATDALKDNPLEQLSLASQMVSQHVALSVVHINVRSARSDDDPMDEFAHIFGPHSRESQGQGSGVIVDNAGMILTNYHVISGAESIQVTLSDKRTVDANVVGYDALTDLAVLKVRADELQAAEWGNSDELRTGSLVWAVGSPFGLEQTVTQGILSGVNRAEKAGTAYQNFLQTDAAVNPGNSGGPLVDVQGRVIGINTAIVGQTYRGISFAIPSSIARQVYDRILQDGHVARGWLGVAMEEMTRERADQLGLSKKEGVYVIAVVNNESTPSPAQKAGIREGDVVVRWNDIKINNRTTLSRAVAGSEIGADVTIEIIRAGERMKLEVTVGERPTRLN